MSRAVTADHILFDECITAFRRAPDDLEPFDGDKGASFSYLLTSFNINQEWDLGICKVSPSTTVKLPGAYTAFISRVDNPDWVGIHNPHLFGIALSAIVSFATQKPCKSTRDDYLCMSPKLSEDEFSWIALSNPIKTAGTGATLLLASSTVHKFCSDIRALINLLFSVDYPTYRTAMQAIRMVHLSSTNKRDDFGLAYLLVVSAIEAIAQKAIKRDRVKYKAPDEEKWKVKAETDHEFKNLLDAYKKERGKNEYLKERFVSFINEFAPVENWVEYVKHPIQDVSDFDREIGSSFNFDRFLKKKPDDIYPEDLDPTAIKEILSDAYDHRSCFIHSGEQPPHREPDPHFIQFFEEHREFVNGRMRGILLPTYALLIGVAQLSITNWLKSRSSG